MSKSGLDAPPQLPFIFLPLISVEADGFVVKDMRVEGLQRISEGTVFNYLPINVGDSIDGVRIAEAIRSIYDQDLFDPSYFLMFFCE